MATSQVIKNNALGKIMIYIIRNNQQFGPYDIQILHQYVCEGKILKQDIAYESTNILQVYTVDYFLKRSKVKVTVAHNGGVIGQLKQVGRSVILPKNVFDKKKLFKDNRFLILASVGLLPVFLIKFTFFSGLTFYAIALYFSMIWGLFYYYLFKTDQVNLKSSILIFFLTQALILVLLLLQSLPGISYLYSLTESSSILYRLIGYIFGVGFFEELIKALPLIYIARFSKTPLVPQSMVYYGLLSGTGFGATEGVLYQTGLNSHLDYDTAFFMNVARLTSLPFLHSIWSGIAGYFIAFAYLYPKFRKSMFLLALGIPALLHGFYDVFGWSLLGLVVTISGVVLLVAYLNKGVDLQSKLKP